VVNSAKTFQNGGTPPSPVQIHQTVRSPIVQCDRGPTGWSRDYVGLRKGRYPKLEGASWDCKLPFWGVGKLDRTILIYLEGRELFLVYALERRRTSQTFDCYLVFIYSRRPFGANHRVLLYCLVYNSGTRSSDY